MSTNEGFLEKMRRSHLGADELPIKEAQEAVIRKEKNLAGKQAAKSHIEEQQKPASGGSSKPARLISCEEASLAFRYGSGVLPFLRDTPASGTSGKPPSLDKRFQDHEKGTQHDMGTQGSISTKYGKSLTSGYIPQTYMDGDDIPREGESRFRSLLRTVAQAQIEIRR